MTADALRATPAAQAIRRHRLVAVLRRVSPRDALLALVGDLADAGVRCFEITLDAPDAGDDLRAVRAALGERHDGPFVVGAGTVLSVTHLDAAVNAGADFAVAPVLSLPILHAATERDLPFVPGALTPTEIRTAWDAGATFVKLFPASAVGPALVRELRGPLPDIELVPTGGVDGSNAAAFLAAGAVAVGIGGAITRASSHERRALVATVLEAAR
jgi:2-dehydro-3-deoxyphosphogluconate aldolase / (4S)-4-hydroxy-2-oxoglutarate aldolase